MSDDIYYEKYLKYKAKYLALKQEGGLLTMKNGVYAFFCSMDDANKICNSVLKKAPSVGEINKFLSRNAFVGKNGESKLTIVRTSANQLGKTTSNIKKTISASSVVTGSRNVIGRVSDIGKAIRGTATAENFNASSQAARDKNESIRVVVDQLKQNIDSLIPNSKPETINLNNPLNALDDETIKEFAGKMKAIKSGIDTVVVLQINSIGSNQCLKKFTV